VVVESSASIVLARKSGMSRAKLFVLPPATTHGAKARVLTAAEPRTAPARRLHAPHGMTLGEAFTYLSGLYFRGKLAYARAFAASPACLGGTGIYVITPTDGLVDPDSILGVADLKRFASAAEGSVAGRIAFEQAVWSLEVAMGPACDVILLGSVGSGKYSDVLEPALGDRLLFPRRLYNEGQLQRGAMLLEHAERGEELEYAPLTRLRQELGPNRQPTPRHR
ncbi:MAG: hypothetical protein ACR2OG_16625, partial [Gemmatimonadaceae bacterium]